MSKYRVGIIGCGNIFPMHAVSVKELECAELVAVCDNKEERAKAKAKEFAVDFYLDYKEMIDQANLDVVHICTPHYLHAEMAIYACKAGVNVLTEKPMSIKLEDAEDMVKAAKENDVTLGVIFQNRYNPGSILIKETLESGALGKVLSAKLAVTWDRSDEYYSNSDWKGTWEKEGGGVVIDQAIHTMDLLRWFVDDEISYVEANIGNRAHEIIEVEDSAEGVIKYKNGTVTGFYTINYYSYNAPVEIELHCEKGIAKLVSDNASVKFNDGREYIAGPNPNETFNYGNVKSYWGVSHSKQINNYYESILKGVKPDLTGDEAIKTQKMICAIYDSGKSRKRIKF
ncbi:Gfo/Idh/MocA family protein [Natronospora cellulosivora (SeqCode)]